jgi:Na+/H+-dicarboxylate symporter
MENLLGVKSWGSIRQGLEDFIRTRLWAKLLFALALGASAGYGVLLLETRGGGTWAKPLADWVALPGSIYLAAIQMVIVPLILSSIILAISGIGKDVSIRAIGTTALVFVFVSTLVAALIGIGVTEFFRPGDAVRDMMSFEVGGEIARQAKLNFSPQVILSMIPTNPLASLLNGDLLEVLMISLIFGTVLTQMEAKQTQPIREFLVATQALCLRVITLAMHLAPYAVFGLMFRAVVNTGVGVLSGMLGYLLCAVFGFLLMAGIYCIWLLLVIRINPFTFFSKSREALLLAFSLSSSAATMPTTLRVAKENFGIDAQIAEILIPLGTTINMAGSAIWQTSAIFFLAQVFGSDINLSTIILVVTLTLGASIGTPGVPGAGLGVLTSSLKSVGVPASGIPLILGVDRLVDMGCTVLNVMGDLVMCLTAEWAVKRQKPQTSE